MLLLNLVCRDPVLVNTLASRLGTCFGAVHRMMVPGDVNIVFCCVKHVTTILPRSSCEPERDNPQIAHSAKLAQLTLCDVGHVSPVTSTAGVDTHISVMSKTILSTADQLRARSRSLLNRASQAMASAVDRIIEARLVDMFVSGSEVAIFATDNDAVRSSVAKKKKKKSGSKRK